MNPQSKWFFSIIALIVLFGGVLWWRSKQNPAERQHSSNVSPANQVEASVVRTESKDAPVELLESAANSLRTAHTAEDKAKALVHLKEILNSTSTNEAVLAIQRFLDIKTDTSTGQGFKIGGGGALLEAPTLRTLLLDQVAMLDPAAAAAYARVILNESTSPDEWAIALRNLARGDTTSAARTLLETKTGELLRNEAWQRDPSVGYLEAFDTAVHLGGTSLLSPLTDLVSKKDNQAVAHAAFLTLDRLVIIQPAQTLTTLNEHPEWMASREETRANYFAREDVGDGTQRQLVESYLLNAERSPSELQTFAGVFPNANFMISHNLLTENTTMDGPTLARRDHVSLEVVSEWLADPKFEKLRQPLTRIQQRLKEFTRQSTIPKSGN